LVKKEFSTKYKCEKCHSSYNDEKEALECENRKYSKEHIDSILGNYTDDWEIGDICISVSNDDDSPIVKLVKIVNTTQESHRLNPVVESLDNNKEDYYGSLYLIDRSVAKNLLLSLEKILPRIVSDEL